MRRWTAWWRRRTGDAPATAEVALDALASDAAQTKPEGEDAASAPGSVEEKTTFDVVLDSVGNEKMRVIDAVRKATSLMLAEAIRFVESAPVTVKEGISREDAEKLRARLEEAGATVGIKPEGANTASESESADDLAALVARLNDRGLDPTARIAAVEKLAGRGGREATDALCARIGAAYDDLSTACAVGLVRLGDTRGVEALSRLLRERESFSASWPSLIAAAETLAQAAPPGAAEALLSALGHPAREVRDAVARALERLGEEPLAAAFESALAGDPGPSEALADARLTDPLTEAACGWDPVVCAGAMAALRRLGMDAEAGARRGLRGPYAGWDEPPPPAQTAAADQAMAQRVADQPRAPAQREERLEALSAQFREAGFGEAARALAEEGEPRAAELLAQEWATVRAHPRNVNGNLRRNVVGALAQLGGPAAVRVCLEAASGNWGDAVLTERAASFLVRQGHPAGVTALRRLLHYDPGVNWAVWPAGNASAYQRAVRTLGEVRCAEAADDLAHAFQRSEGATQTWAAEALAAIGGPVAAAALARVVEGFAASRQTVPQELGRALGACARDALPHLLRMAATQGWEPRRCAAYALGFTAAPEAAAALVPFLRDNEEFLRTVALAGLHRLGRHAWSVREQIYRASSLREPERWRVLAWIERDQAEHESA